MEFHTDSPNDQEKNEEKLAKIFALGEGFNQTFTTLADIKITGETKKAIDEMEKFLNAVEELVKLQASSVFAAALKKKTHYFSEDMSSYVDVSGLVVELSQIKELINVYAPQLPVLKEVISNAKEEFNNADEFQADTDLGHFVPVRIQEAIKTTAEVLGISFDVVKETLDLKHPPANDFEKDIGLE